MKDWLPPIEGNYAEIALVENLLRQDLTAVEEAEALQSLMNDRQYTQDQRLRRCNIALNYRLSEK